MVWNLFIFSDCMRNPYWNVIILIFQRLGGHNYKILNNSKEEISRETADTFTSKIS